MREGDHYQQKHFACHGHAGHALGPKLQRHSACSAFHVVVTRRPCVLSDRNTSPLPEAVRSMGLAANVQFTDPTKSLDLKS